MQKQTINLTINGIAIDAAPGQTILETALSHDIYIPHICYAKDLKPTAVCRLCVVEVEGRGLITACNTPAAEGMIIKTESDAVNATRRPAIKLLLANHKGGCLQCSASQRCLLLKAANHVGIEPDEMKPLIKKITNTPIDSSNPFFDFDPDRCVLCGRCVRTCDELQNINSIDYMNRGYQTVVAPFANKKWADSRCESCGECVAHCPTGALSYKQHAKPSNEILSTCSYCGCGCSIYFGVRDNKIVSARGNPDAAANHGSLCVKGRFGFKFVNHPDRLTHPLIKRDGKFEKASWDEALDLIAKQFKGLLPSQFALFASAKCTNEDNYVLQKFARGVMKTNNVDHCARLCHAPTVAGLAQSFGSGAMTNNNDDIGQSKCIFAIGTNTTEAHPIIALQVKRAAREGATLIVANPKRINLCRHATLFLQHRPGTDVVLLMGMARVIIDEGLEDSAFIKARCENLDALVESLNTFDLETVEKITGVPKEKIEKAARLYAATKPGSILYAMGITQHTHGTDNVLAISNLAMLTGNVGKVGSGVNPLRGQNNVQGACDMGALPNVYPGYQKVIDPVVKAKFEKAWGVQNLDDQVGLTHTDIFDGVCKGEIKSLYIAGENPVLSEANANHVKEALDKAGFVVVQDIFMTETAQYADVVLPATTFAEKDGTFTSSERRIQRVRRVIDNVGESRGDWEIVCQIAKRMQAKGFDFKSSEAVLAEIAALTPIYAGINYQRIEKEGLQWPCLNEEHPGTAYLHKDKFARENGKGKFFPLVYRESMELPDSDYPFLLTTDRSIFHFHTGTMSRHVKGLNDLHPNEWLVINPNDAKKLGIEDGQMLTVTSRRGQVNVKAKIIDLLGDGVVSMHFHFAETPTNELTNSATDPLAKIPETKVCAVRIRV